MLATGTLTAFGLYLIRTSALVLAAPVFGNGSTFSGYRVGLIAVLALLLFGAGGMPVVEPVTPVGFAALALREVLIGLVLAMVLQLVMVTVRVAGEMIGHEMAFNMSSVVDPATGVSTPIVTQIWETLFLIGLLGVNGHHWLIRALSDSYARAPVGVISGGAPASDLESVQNLTHLVRTLFEQSFRAGLTLAAPVLVLLFLVSLMIGLLARAVPQLNLLEAGFTLRILIGLAAMFLFAPLLAPAMDTLYGVLHVGLDDALLLVGE
jgi:flagellar biosynthetic protein FliR